MRTFKAGSGCGQEPIIFFDPQTKQFIEAIIGGPEEFEEFTFAKPVDWLSNEAGEVEPGTLKASSAHIPHEGEESCGDWNRDERARPKKRMRMHTSISVEHLPKNTRWTQEETAGSRRRIESVEAARIGREKRVASNPAMMPLALSDESPCAGSRGASDPRLERSRITYHGNVRYDTDYRIRLGRHINIRPIVRHVSIQSQVASIGEVSAAEGESPEVEDWSVAGSLSPSTESWLLDYWSSTPPSSESGTEQATPSSSGANSDDNEIQKLSHLPESWWAE